MKIYYLFDQATGEYSGIYEAQENPLEPGAYISPVHSTDLAPPAQIAGQVAVFANGAWVLTPDFRGQTWYDAQGNAMVITSIGALPNGLTSTLPPALAFVKAEADFISAVSGHLNTTVQARGYDSMVSCVSYRQSTNPTFAAEAVAAISWRDAVWLYCYAQLAAVQAGTRAIPASEAAFIAELPVLVW